MVHCGIGKALPILDATPEESELRQSLSADLPQDGSAPSWPDYETFRSLALALLLPLGLRLADSEDLVQEALLAGLCRRDSIRHPIRWFAVKIRRDAWRLMAKNRRCLLLPPDELATLADRHTRAEPRHARLEANRILTRLPAPKARLLALLYGEGLSEPETAAALGLSPNSIKKLRTRALAAARRLLVARTHPTPARRA